MRDNGRLGKLRRNRRGMAVRDAVEVGKRERPKTHDVEDLFWFHVEEKVFPVYVKEEDEGS
jgi:hypothetical protein